jgi:hypothetical protein
MRALPVPRFTPVKGQRTHGICEEEGLLPGDNSVTRHFVKEVLCSIACPASARKAMRGHGHNMAGLTPGDRIALEAPIKRGTVQVAGGRPPGV